MTHHWHQMAQQAPDGPEIAIPRSGQLDRASDDIRQEDFVVSLSCQRPKEPYMLLFNSVASARQNERIGSSQLEKCIL